MLIRLAIDDVPVFGRLNLGPLFPTVSENLHTAESSSVVVNELRLGVKSFLFRHGVVHHLPKRPKNALRK